MFKLYIFLYFSSPLTINSVLIFCGNVKNHNSEIFLNLNYKIFLNLNFEIPVPVLFKPKSEIF